MSAIFKIFWLITFVLITSTSGNVSFNYEISHRVSDLLTAFMSKVVQAGTVSITAIQSGAVNINDFLDISSRYLVGRNLFFSLKVVYQSEIQVFQIGFENHLYFAYCNRDPGLFSNIPYGIYTEASWAYDYTMRSQYMINMNGLPDQLMMNQSFDCVKQPWYMKAKAAKRQIWSSPFVQSNNLPSISLVTPIQNISNYDTFGGTYQFIGALAVNVQLDQLSRHLKNSYFGTDKSVYIIEKNSGILIASSVGAQTYLVNGTTVVLMPAIQSEVDVISDTTKLMNDLNWPNHLVVYKSNFIQNFLYTDSLPGLVWHVVVLLPAAIQPNYLSFETNPTLYITLTTISSISLLITVCSLIVNLVLWRTRLFRLTKPIFSTLNLLAGIFFIISTFTRMGENTNNNCYIRAWLFAIPITAFIAPLTIKSYMLYHLFVINPFGKNKTIRNDMVVLITFLSILLASIIVIIAMNIGGGIGSVINTTISTDGAYVQVIQCNFDNNKAYVISGFFYNFLLLGIGCYYSYLIRNLDGVVSGTYIHMIIIYNLTMFAITYAVLSNIVIDFYMTIAAEIILICYVVVVAAVLNIGPNLYTMCTIGDVAAAETVLDNIMRVSIR